jgi:hypothetical protein
MLNPIGPNDPFDVECPECNAMGFISDNYCAQCGAKMDG